MSGTSYSGEYGNVGYILKVKVGASMTVSGGADSWPQYAVSGNDLSFGFEDALGTKLELVQDWERDSVSVNVGIAGATLGRIGAETFKLEVSTEGALPTLTGTISASVERDGEEIELNNSVSVSVSAFALPSKENPDTDVWVPLYGHTYLVNTTWTEENLTCTLLPDGGIVCPAT